MHLFSICLTDIYELSKNLLHSLEPNICDLQGVFETEIIEVSVWEQSLQVVLECYFKFQGGSCLICSICEELPEILKLFVHQLVEFDFVELERPCLMDQGGCLHCFVEVNGDVSFQ